MICLARQLKSIRPIFQSLTPRLIQTAIQRRTIRFNGPSGPAVREKKKLIRLNRREQEKKEAKTPGTEAFLKAERKAEKLAKKEARRARIAAGEPLTDEADIKAEEQADRDREKLAKSRATPVRRQARRDWKQDKKDIARKTPNELREEEERGSRIHHIGEARPRFQSKFEKTDSRLNRIRSPDYKPRVYKTKEEYELERSKRGTQDFGKTNDGPGSRESSYNPRDDNTREAPQEFVSNHFDRSGGSTRPAGAFSPRSDRPQHGKRDTANNRAWDSRNKGDETLSGRRDRRQDFNGHNDRSVGRDSDERYAKREPWMVQKEAVKRKIGGEAWAPPKRLSPDTLEAIRTMHKSDPDKFSTPILAQQFKQSPEVIRRILRTKWQPNEEEVLDRQERWERRGEKIWTKQAELGVRPPKKWREMGVANTGESGVAPRWKKNAHAGDKYGDRPKHFVAQRRGSSSDYEEAGFRKPFSERIL